MSVAKRSRHATLWGRVSYVQRHLPFAFLSPDLVEQIIEGRQPSWCVLSNHHSTIKARRKGPYIRPDGPHLVPNSRSPLVLSSGQMPEFRGICRYS